MVDDDRTKEDATIGADSANASGESGQVRGIQEKSTTELVARIRELLFELESEEYISHIGRNRIQNSIALNIRKLDAMMSNGAGIPEQWMMIFQGIED
jgi:hypothetical protein